MQIEKGHCYKMKDTPHGYCEAIAETPAGWKVRLLTRDSTYYRTDFLSCPVTTFVDAHDLDRDFTEEREWALKLKAGLFTAFPGASAHQLEQWTMTAIANPLYLMQPIEEIIGLVRQQYHQELPNEVFLWY